MFLQAQVPRHNGPDLLERVLRFLPALEIQVNVSAANGEPVDGKRGTFTDGVNQWFNIRIPHNADSEPQWHDYELRWPLDLYAEGIGSTGWDWQSRQSRWVGFDVDSITGHATGVGLSDAELQSVKKAAEALPYVEVRKSTSGKGLHFYIYFSTDGIPTANHTEHAALARCILGMMSSTTGFDFASQIDACGGNMWIWHRKMDKANNGLALIKPAERSVSVDDLPGNWRDHIEVVTRRRAKIRINSLQIEHEDPFELLANSRRLVPLDESHKSVIEELGRSGFSTVWIPDYHLLQTHTKALQNLIDDPGQRSTLKLKGIFRTISEGKDPATCNCFCFPLDNGAWRVYRFSPGTAEAETWEQDGNGWTNCFFNKTPDLNLAARAGGGVEAPNNGGYVFPTANDVANVVKMLGQTIDIPQQFEQRETRLKPQKDGRVVIAVKKNNPNEAAPQGWLNDRTGLTRVLSVQAEIKAQATDESYSEYDKIARFLVTPDNKSVGWVGRSRSGRWIDGNKDDMKGLLLKLGKTKSEADVIIPDIWSRHWTLVNLPFLPEYPGDRQWNRESAQYRFQPIELQANEAPHHPHWDMVLKHCFGDLDEAIRDHPWAQRANVKTGADYGLMWMACLLRDPFQHLPYLFFYGNEDCGKSIFHESFDYLITKGRVSANLALTNQNGFNGELAGAILAYVEELDISKTPGALAKIKEWVMSPTIPIRQMRRDTYSLPNTLHFIQVANSPDFCPIFPGDTRVTMIHVPPLSPDVLIPRRQMEIFLIQEAPHFMRTILDVTLPNVEGRIGVPIIETHNKFRVQERRRDPLEQFIAENCHAVVGEKILFSEFCERFLEWLAPEDRGQWSKQKISRQLPQDFPSGAHTQNKKYIGNLSWEPKQPEPNTRPWIAVNGRLTLK
ncbi:MAG: primase-helicase family protein [Thermoguttaceae bacterium]